MAEEFSHSRGERFWWNRPRWDGDTAPVQEMRVESFGGLSAGQSSILERERERPDDLAVRAVQPQRRRISFVWIDSPRLLALIHARVPPSLSSPLPAQPIEATPTDGQLRPHCESLVLGPGR